MSFFAEPNHIEYDAWFDENIDPVDLVNYLEHTDLLKTKDILRCLDVIAREYGGKVVDEN